MEKRLDKAGEYPVNILWRGMDNFASNVASIIKY